MPQHMPNDFFDDRLLLNRIISHGVIYHILYDKLSLFNLQALLSHLRKLFHFCFRSMIYTGDIIQDLSY